MGVIVKLFAKKKSSLSQWIEKIEEREKVRIFKIKGNLDITAVAQIEQFVTLMKQRKGHDFKHVLLDFAEVTQIDFSTVAALLKTLRDYLKSYQKLALINVNEQPQNMLWLAKVGHLFPSYISQDEAIRDLETRF
ncbi:MAG TPA: hypothetical protein DIS66_05825 [Candidatus Omnitrophica bacterium]|nr:hypothetical protein [Candidatus Omnitrophota bacterium]